MVRLLTPECYYYNLNIAQFASTSGELFLESIDISQTDLSVLFKGLMWSYSRGTWSALAATVLARSVMVLLASLAEPAWGVPTASDHCQTKASENSDWLSPVVCCL